MAKSKAQKKKYTYKYPVDRKVTVRGAYRVVTKHVRCNTEEEFEQIKAELQAKADRPEIVDPTVREWSETWLTEYRIADGITAKSYSMYPNMLNNYILPVIGDRRISTVTEDDCDMVMVRMRGLSRAYQHQMLLVLRAMMKQAKKRGLIKENPAEDTDFDRAKDPKKRRPITRAERYAIERAADREFGLDGKPNLNGALFLMTLRCGLRPGEVCALRKADLDLVNRYIHVRQARERGSNTIKDPKTIAGTRDVPIPESFAEWLQWWLQKHPTHPDCEYVFAMRDRLSRVTESSYDKRWKAFKKLVDLELGATMEYVPGAGRKRVHKVTRSIVADDLVPYCLRVTYATDCVKAGVHPSVLQTLMGHTSIEVTNRYYVMVDEELLEQGREQIDALDARRNVGNEENAALLAELSDAIRGLEIAAGYGQDLVDAKAGELVNTYAVQEVTPETELAAARRALAAMQARVADLESKMKK